MVEIISDWGLNTASIDQGAGWQKIEIFLAGNIHMYSLLVLIQQALLKSGGIMPATAAAAAAAALPAG